MRNASPPTQPDDKKPRKKAVRSRAASPTQKLLTGAQVEAEYGIPYRSLYDLAKGKGVLEYVQFPASDRLWFERRTIENLIQQNRTRAAEQHA